MEHITNLSSFDIAVLAEIRKYDSNIEFGFLRGNQLPTESDFQKMEDDGNSRFLIGYSLLMANPTIGEQMANRGIGIGVWDVKTKDDVNNCLALGVTKIISELYIGGVR